MLFLKHCFQPRSQGFILNPERGGEGALKLDLAFCFCLFFFFWAGGGGGGSVTENICIWLNPWFALVILVDVTLHGKLDIASLITDFWAQVTL